MKNWTSFLKSLPLLAALFCTMGTAVAQDIHAPATFDAPGNAAVPVMFKAPSLDMSFRIGDVNGDGQVNISDITDLITAVLNDKPVDGGDVNRDGQINITDITDLIAMVLNDTSVYSTTTAQSMLNEVYDSMHKAGWSTTGNTHQCFGISAYNLAAEVMGDDFIVGAQGSGWFWFDAAYNVKGRYTSNTWRSYDLWNAYYTWIANANYLLAASQTMSGTTAQKNYIIGQAYAIRAYSYFMLAQSFARTYKGHESDPCVPIFNGTSFHQSTRTLRSTVAEVYAQIDSDINQAINLLNGTSQQNPSHIGYAVALGLRARIALVEENWDLAYSSATSAITASGKRILNVSDFKGLNDATAANVMWGVQIPADGVGMYASLWAHMDINKAYAQRAPKRITPWLYGKMSATDARRAWWDPENGYSDGNGANVSIKFSVKEGTEWEGDYIYMRVEEMYLTAAEAACRKGQATLAKNNLNQLMSKRDPNYTCSKTGTSLGALTTDETGSLLEEILIQRRIELWGEDGRIYTIRRLRQGFERTAENGWPATLMLSDRTLNDPESYPWVLTIPQAEFYNYYSRMILDADQNPLGDAYEAPTVVERTPQHLSFTNATQSFEVSAAASLNYFTVNMTRPNRSSKPYIALLRMIDNDANTVSWHYVTFNANATSSNVSIPFTGSSMTLGRHVYTLSLTDLEMSVANSSQQTSTTLVVDVSNFGAEGQHISFESANQDIVMYNQGYLEIPITITRAKTTYAYRAELSISEESDPEDMSFTTTVIFPAGESTATAKLYIYETQFGDTYSCVLKLSDADIATGNPSLGEQITSTTVTVQVKEDDEDWIPAGTCTFTDYTWEDGYSATGVPVEKSSHTNMYRIISPLAYVYDSSYESGQGSDANWKFAMNPDGSIEPEEGDWALNYWGYYGYYYPSLYANYCYVAHEGTTYDVHFLLHQGQSLYHGGHFQFILDR